MSNFLPFHVLILDRFLSILGPQNDPENDHKSIPIIGEIGVWNGPGPKIDLGGHQDDFWTTFGRLWDHVGTTFRPNLDNVLI